MAVRVKVRAINERAGKTEELVVLVNGGAESEEPYRQSTQRRRRDSASPIATLN